MNRAVIKVVPVDYDVTGEQCVQCEDVVMSDVNLEAKENRSDDVICSEAIRQARHYFKIEDFSCGEKKTTEIPKGLNKLLFYQLVQGGNVESVTDILDRIQRPDPVLFRCLLDGRNRKRENDGASRCVTWSRWAAVVANGLLCLVFVLTTPVFYLLHFIGQCLQTGNCEPEGVQLPLLFAALSDSAPMVRAFRRRHPDILRARDGSLNNVFHLLALASAKDSRPAVQCLRLLVGVFGAAAAREVVLGMRNEDGLNAVESSVKVGSPLYFTELVETEGIIKRTIIAVGSDRVYDARRKGDDDDVMTTTTMMTSPPLVRYSVVHYDVTMYERGDVFLNQSFLLNLLSGRELMSMTEEEVNSIKNCPIFKHWTSAKIRLNVIPVCCHGLLIFYLWMTHILYTLASDVSAYHEWVQVTFRQGLSDAMRQVPTWVNGTECTAPSLDANHTVAEVWKIARCSVNAACGFDVAESLARRDVAEEKSNADRMITASLAVTVVLLAFDLYSRVVFLAVQYQDPGWRGERQFSQLVRRMFTRRMQVSYVSKQLSVVANLCLILSAVLDNLTQAIDVDDEASFEDKVNLRSAINWFIVSGVVCRAFCTLYNLRVYNVGSHFIIGMWKLSKTLVQFSFVYFMTGSMFSVLLSHVAVDPDCPARKLTAFDGTFVRPMLSGFRLMLGDSLLPATMGSQLGVVYAVFVIVAGVVMLSLFTGISGSVADRVLSPLLRDVLLLKERLEESVSVETAALLSVLPFRRAVHRWWLKTNAAYTKFVIREDGDDTRIVLEVENRF